jgi:hypothetical protein
MDAAVWPEFQPVCRLFSHCVGDCMPDLIFQPGCRRARDRYRGEIVFLAGFDRPQHPDFTMRRSPARFRGGDGLPAG